jgi:hypothetical protein
VAGCGFERMVVLNVGGLERCSRAGLFKTVRVGVIAGGRQAVPCDMWRGDR